MLDNNLALGVVADFGALNCQDTIKVDVGQNASNFHIPRH